MKQRSNPLSWIEVEGVELTVAEFPDGSFRFSGDFDPKLSEITITLKSTLPEAMVAMWQVCGVASMECPDAWIVANIQTFPDQRADRSEKPGMSIPVACSAGILGNMPVNQIIVHDLHSSRGLHALDVMCEHNGIKLTHIEPIECFLDTLYGDYKNHHKIDVVVAVDKGATDRAQQIEEHFHTEIIFADKKRVDGQVVGHEISGATGMIRETDTIWIVDDLCDGGATFISIAKLLRETYKFDKLNLYVTHGLFSKGKKELSQHYDNILARFDYSGV